MLKGIVSFFNVLCGVTLWFYTSSLYPRYAHLKKKENIKTHNEESLFIFDSLRTNFLPFLRDSLNKENNLFRSYTAVDTLNTYMNAQQQSAQDMVAVKPYVPFTFMIRVLLDEQALDGKSWALKTDGSFVIYNAQTRKEELLEKQEIFIKLLPDGFYIANNKVGDAVMIRPTTGYITFDGYEYPGTFIIRQKDAKAYLINQVDIEDYLYCVLRWESWPGWPLEVNKAFAIGCRSYVIAKVHEATKSNRLYHIKNSNLHQTYNGIHKYDCLRQAICETRGLVLTYNKKPIEAMFDCCCGGVIPAHITAINVQKTPYLARKVPCTFCQGCKIYRWRYECSTNELKSILKEAGYQIGPIGEVRVAKADKVGYVQQVVIRDRTKSITLTGRQMYSLINKVKSFVYSIEKKGRSVVFAGKGYGHHLGICQWGARKMVDLGWSYQKILAFYYPQTQIMELKNTVKKDAKL